MFVLILKMSLGGNLTVRPPLRCEGHVKVKMGAREHISIYIMTYIILIQTIFLYLVFHAFIDYKSILHVYVLVNNNRFILLS